MNASRPAPQKPVIIIPSRMNSKRLPGKPLADIHGLPMIAHVMRRALESGIGLVVVACDGKEIAEAVERTGGKAVVTDPDHPSGSDRIWEALTSLPDHETYDAVINVQGDEPTLDPQIIRAAWNLLSDPAVDIATVAAPIRDEAKKQMRQVVKPVIDLAPGTTHGRALYFSRNPVPAGEGSMYHHVGLYAYRRDALARFVASPPSPLEKRESLEQLRALSLGLRVEVAIIDTVPMGVDTPEDLEQARRALRVKQ
jgi:3-deoxy-manno-octulosonate cytidylyltransferase (CMP-KDO synthetase)